LLAQGFSRCSAPEYPVLKYYGALHLLVWFGCVVSTNITGALHLDFSIFIIFQF
jgi:hypothetical protein